MGRVERIKKFIAYPTEKPELRMYLVSACAGTVLSPALMIINSWGYHLTVSDILVAIVWGPILGVLFIHPLMLTVWNVFYLIRGGAYGNKEKNLEIITIIEGAVYSGVLMFFSGFTADWYVAITPDSLHYPIWSEALPTVIVLSGAGVAGYLALSRVPLCRLSPLGAVFAISGMYVGIIECILWIVQVTGKLTGVVWFYLSLFPFNMIVLAFKVMRRKISEWNGEKRTYDGRFLAFINKKLENALLWPAAALIAMLPLLMIMFAVLMLFGQKTENAVRAWTETADWRMSMRQAPPDLNGHYLCTVAACGHPRLVKPLRLGKRHGKTVVVNRQLCVANAFEEIIREKTPRLHRAVRGAYDKYGLPIARFIKTKPASDAVYIAMKPLEWMFLFVIYLSDAEPEKRIAAQYR